MVGLLFITAKDVDYKLINRLLVDLRDWGYGDTDYFHMVRSRNEEEIPAATARTEDGFIDIAGSITESNLGNEWAGASLDEVTAFCAKVDRGLFIVVDNEGIRNHTGILVEKAYYYEEDGEEKPPYDYKKLRLNWDGLYINWCNLDIANMGFEEYCEDDGEDTEDGWFTASEFALKPLEEDFKKKRDEFSKSLEDKGCV